MKASFLWGIIIVLIGLVLLLNNLGMTNLDIGEIFVIYWPVIFIIWGLETIIEKKHRNNTNLIFGGLLLILGAGIIGRNLGYFSFDFSILWGILWPLLLILVGINILKSGAFSKKGSIAIMSGFEKKRNGWKLTGQLPHPNRRFG